MKTITAFVFLNLLLGQQSFGQFVYDDFSDGDLSSSPVWSGTSSHFITNGLEQLQLNNTVAGTSYLSTPVGLNDLNNVEWIVYVKQTFSGSNTNFGRVYLASNVSDLTTAAINGYYLQFGEANATDAVRLFRQNGAAAPTLLCSGTASAIANSFEVRVKVTRDNAGLWELYVDYSGGMNFVFQDSEVDLTFTTAEFAGIRCTYTISNINKFFYDDFTIQPLGFDGIKPTVQGVSVVDASTLDVTFSEKVNNATGTTLSHYSLPNGVNPTAATLQANETTVRLSFQQTFTNGVETILAVSGVTDLAGNQMNSAQPTFLYFQAMPAAFRDLIISEIFPDPSPSVGLPDAEFIEIFNRSINPIDINGWKFTDGTSTAVLPTRIVLPGEYYLVASNNNLSKFSLSNKIGTTVFPSLNNSGDQLKLLDPADTPMDSVNYSQAWYRDDDKEDGGYTLEIINPLDDCRDSLNWLASNAAIGGTPGLPNSVAANEPDLLGPSLLLAEEINATTVDLIFDEKLSANVPAPETITIEPQLAISLVKFTNGGRTRLRLDLATPIEEGRTYLISVSGILDCPGNPILPDKRLAYLNFDDQPPSVEGLLVPNQNELHVAFSEKIVMSTNNFLFSDNLQPVATLSDDNKQVNFYFTEPLPQALRRSITIKNVMDVSGNVMPDTTLEFFFALPAVPSYKDVVINEFLPDPLPQVSLPQAEFVEIFNRSDKAFDLLDWTIGDRSSRAKLPSRFLLPGDHLVITTSSAASLFEGFVVGLGSFPSLNNSDDTIVIQDSNGNTIDSLTYNLSWFADDDKEQGGWSLEMINPENICAQEQNWRASLAADGGTPGFLNSIFSTTPDNAGPRILLAVEESADTISILFDERLSATLPSVESIVINPPLEIDNVSFRDKALRELLIKLRTPIAEGQAYLITLNNLFDCQGNMITDENKSVFLNLDLVSPELTSVVASTQQTLLMKFSERLKTTSISSATFNLTGLAITSFSVSEDRKEVELTFDRELKNGVRETITLQGIADLAENVMKDTTFQFFFFEPAPPSPKDVIIGEVFADPAPTVGLPEAEFIEVINRSDKPFNLSGWSISDGSSKGRLEEKILLPGDYAILTSAASVSLFKTYGNVVGVTSIPSFNNSGDAVILRDDQGFALDSINYSIDWYQDDDKAGGGWSLELIDPENVCAEETNWTASESEVGGTPGRQNSVYANNPDLDGPVVQEVFTDGDKKIMLTFNEKLGSTPPQREHVDISPAVTIEQVLFADQSFRRVAIVTQEPLLPSTGYIMNIREVRDCAGNETESINGLLFALPEAVSPGDVLINEVLFNPRPGGVDFVELVNVSNKYIDLQTLALGELDDDTFKLFPLAVNSTIFAPQSVAAVTTERTILENEYPSANDRKIIEVKALPSFPDDEGEVILVDTAQILLDYFKYLDDMHAPLLKDDEGVSLERISLSSSTGDARNWRSASATSGFATPGFRNSNATADPFALPDAVMIEPEIFEPGTGQPSFTQIRYSFDKGGWIANLKIIDTEGRLVKQLASNESIATEGFFRWDGDDETGRRARIGYYLIWFEVFDDTGVIRTYKKRVAVAGRFK